MDMGKTTNIDSETINLNSLLNDELQERLSDQVDLGDIGRIDLFEAEAIANEEVMVLNEADFLEDLDKIPMGSFKIPTYEEFAAMASGKSKPEEKSPVAEEMVEEEPLNSSAEGVSDRPTEENTSESLEDYLGEDLNSGESSLAEVDGEEEFFLNIDDDSDENLIFISEEDSHGGRTMDISDLESIPGKFGDFGTLRKRKSIRNKVPPDEPLKFYGLEEGEFSYFENSMFGDKQKRDSSDSETISSHNEKKGESREQKLKQDISEETILDITDRVVILEDDEEVNSFADKFPDKKEDLIKLFTYLDGLFEKLPEDMIMKFADSEYFDLYMKVIDEMD